MSLENHPVEDGHGITQHGSRTSNLFAAVNAGAKPIMAVEEDWF